MGIKALNYSLECLYYTFLQQLWLSHTTGATQYKNHLMHDCVVLLYIITMNHCTDILVSKCFANLINWLCIYPSFMGIKALNYSLECLYYTILTITYTTGATQYKISKQGYHTCISCMISRRLTLTTFEPTSMHMMKFGCLYMYNKWIAEPSTPEEVSHMNY